MAAKKETPKTVERTYTVPLRKEFRKVPRWRKTKKAVTALRQFVSKHMKSENVKLSTALNQEMWKHGGKNPPSKVKINVTKDEQGMVNADLFGVKKETPAVKKKETKKAAPKAQKE